MRRPAAHWPAGLPRAKTLDERAEELALRMAERPVASLEGLLALNLGLAVCFLAAGGLVGDQALFFRELAPGTWLSFAQLLLIAAIAGTIHRLEADGRRWYQTFWGLSAGVFVVFAFDEITQATIFLSHLLESGFGLTAADGFHDLQAVLLTLGFAVRGADPASARAGAPPSPAGARAVRRGGRARDGVTEPGLVRAHHPARVRRRGDPEDGGGGVPRRRDARRAQGRAGAARGKTSALTSSHIPATTAAPVSHPASTSVG